MRDDQIEKFELAESIFTPRDPIKRTEYLSGRQNQLTKVLGAIKSSSTHCIIFGERGVGKTSVANCVVDFIQNDDDLYALPIVNCDSQDDFESIWRKVYSKIHFTDEGMGFIPSSVTSTADDIFQGEVTPFTVQNSLQILSSEYPIIVVLDEFDRVSDKNTEAVRLLTDTMKGICDQGIQATVVIIGVADSVNELISQHESISRQLVEVLMPRMSPDEEKKIIKDRLPKLDLTITESDLSAITSISRGFPYYIHLIGLAASKYAILNDKDTIDIGCIRNAMQEAMNESMQSLKNSYYEATTSPNPRNKYPHTLAACALAKSDEFGYFYPKDIIPPLSQITGKEQKTGAFSERLVKLASDERGRILQKKGESYNTKYRFTDPLMLPYTIIKSLGNEIIRFNNLKG